MKIQLKTNFYGAWRGNTGDIVDRPDAEAQHLIAKKQAMAVEPQPAKAPATGEPTINIK